MKKNYTVSELQTIKIPEERPFVIFLRGDLWTGKTTLSQHILKNLLNIWEEIVSPTYTYYHKYNNHYHFDLYRLQDYEEFFAIGWEEILDNNAGVILIEWPEIIEKYYTPDLEIFLSYTDDENERNITILPYHE